jgi:hypothetical protein
MLSDLAREHNTFRPWNPSRNICMSALVVDPNRLFPSRRAGDMFEVALQQA